LYGNDLCPIIALDTVELETLHLLANQTRRDFLNHLSRLTPFLTTLAGPKASAELGDIALAIIDVSRWWP
jgi:hypothetical protein